MAFSQRGRADINVTPLIDVLLVLLVIFMIVIPKTVKIEELDVPPADAGDPMPVLVVAVKADLSVVVTDEEQDYELAASELTVGLRRHVRDQTHVVFVEFDDAVLWDQVVATVDTVKAVAPTAQVALKVRE
jgi:biopolymer transport protein ExbD